MYSTCPAVGSAVDPEVADLEHLRPGAVALASGPAVVRDHTDLLILGLAISSSPTERLNSPMNRMTMITIGGRNHHHIPSSSAELKITQ